MYVLNPPQKVMPAMPPTMKINPQPNLAVGLQNQFHNFLITTRAFETDG
jgi:hypothetical protein